MQTVDRYAADKGMRVGYVINAIKHGKLKGYIDKNQWYVVADTDGDEYDDKVEKTRKEFNIVMEQQQTSPPVLGWLGIILLSILLWWVITGEFSAQLLDDALGVSATECVSEQSIKNGDINTSAVGMVFMSLSTPEMMYIKLRNHLIKDCN